MHQSALLSSNSVVMPTHRYSTLEVVQTSKLEKSVDTEGNAKINDYTLTKNLGSGAFGKVKLAQKSEQELFVGSNK